MRAITQVEIEQIIWQANKSQRKRAILKLHHHTDTVQRMVNAVIPGSYIRPHKHETPDKKQLFRVFQICQLF